MNSILLTANNLKVSYDRQVALNISELNLSANVIGLLGHNGAGKSTLLKTLLDLLVPQAGKLEAFDSAGKKLIPAADMAFCPENGAVFEDIKVEDYLRVWLRIKRKNISFQDEEVAQLIDLFEISPLLKKLGRELSKGQRRRVQSVVGFLIKPKLFLFDEPFDGLDIQKTAELSEIIESKKSEICFIISSHRMDVMERVCDAGLVLTEGKLIAVGQIDQLSTSLAGKSLVFNLPEGYKLNTNSINLKNTDCNLSHIGHSLIFTGHSCDEEKIRQNFGLAGLKASVRAPSLTDAMAFHLKQMSSQVLKST